MFGFGFRVWAVVLDREGLVSQVDDSSNFRPCRAATYLSSLVLLLMMA